MGNVVNLRRARKRRSRTDQAAEADVNRALHGRSKAAGEADAAEHVRRERALDRARREDQGS